MTVQIFVGDCLTRLRAMEAESVHMCCTSPPYWGLRDYGIEPSIWGGDPKCEHVFADETTTLELRKGAGLAVLGLRMKGGGHKQASMAAKKVTIERGFCIHCNAWRGCFGLEPTYQLYIEHTVEIFNEVWRVLRKDGTLWLNLGDCYATRANGWSAKRTTEEGGDDRRFRDKPFSTVGGGFQADGSARVVSRRGRSGNLGNGGKNGVAVPAGRVTGFNPSHARKVRGDFKAGDRQSRHETAGRVVAQGALKDKDMAGIPWRVALALQDAGWWLRRDIIWAKRNPMPESVYDRPTTAHEYIFLFSKSGNTLCWRHRDGQWLWKRPAADWIWRHRESRLETRTPQTGKDWIKVNLWRGFDYYYDFAAIMEPSSPNSHARAARNRSSSHKYADGGPGGQTIAIQSPVAGRYVPAPAGWDDGDGHHGSVHRDDRRQEVGIGQRARPRKAVPNLLEPKATGPNSRIIVDRVPRSRKLAPHDTDGPRTKSNDSFDVALATSELVAMRNKRSVWSLATKPFKEAHFATFPPALVEPCILAGCPKGGVVLDPFGGAGTVGLVADQLGRSAVLIEINPEYAAMAEARIARQRMGPEERKRQKTKASGKLKGVKGLPLFSKQHAVDDDSQGATA